MLSKLFIKLFFFKCQLLTFGNENPYLYLRIMLLELIIKYPANYELRLHFIGYKYLTKTD